jgi:hypothetical protein
MDISSPTKISQHLQKIISPKASKFLLSKPETVSPIDRARLKLEKAQRQIEAGCRKGMRKTTYQRLLRQYEAAQENYDLLFLKEARKLQLLNEKRQKKENDRWGGAGENCQSEFHRPRSSLIFCACNWRIVFPVMKKEIRLQQSLGQ